MEAEFEREVRETLEEQAPYLPRPEALPVPVGTRRQQLVQIAAINPRAAILDAWQGIEFALKKAAIQRIGGSPPPDLGSPVRLVRDLSKASIITPEELLDPDLDDVQAVVPHRPVELRRRPDAASEFPALPVPRHHVAQPQAVRWGRPDEVEHQTLSSGRARGAWGLPSFTVLAQRNQSKESEAGAARLSSHASLASE